MTCEECEKAQHEKGAKLLAIEYEGAPVLILACKLHLFTILEKLFPREKLLAADFVLEFSDYEDMKARYPCRDCVEMLMSSTVSFFRVNTANVMFIGCREHLKTVYDALREKMYGKKEEG